MSNPQPMEEDVSEEQQPFSFRVFCDRFIPHQSFDLDQLMESTSRGEFQVAGHSGFLTTRPAHCLKPINPRCVRSRREHLFYQMAKLFENCTDVNSLKLYYKDFKLLINPDKPCDCQIDANTFKTISRNIPNFLSVRRLSIISDNQDTDVNKRTAYLNALFSDDTWCPCYGNDRLAKNQCSVDFKKENYLCMNDLQAHCELACVLDIKIGRITYDPMANEAKVQEQTSKYKRVRDFGFRILGLRAGLINRDKTYGKSLDNQEQVFEAIESFFSPLYQTDRKVAVSGRMLERLEHILEWFETMNNNQLRFYSSSLLFVYDLNVRETSNDTNEDILKRMADSVRVTMIDFAHVFHCHDLPEGPSRSGSGSSIFTSGTLNKDDNYLYGLRRLVKFFIMLNRQHRIRLQEEQKANKSGWKT